MAHWKGPHSGIIASTPGLDEYRQIHLAENNPGRWPEADGIETGIPVDRKVDGVAEVTFHSVLSPALGIKQTKMAFQDEVNVFRRTLLYAGAPNSSHWYDVGGDAPTRARALIYLRRRPGVRAHQFRKLVTHELVPELASAGNLTELRSQTFLPWAEKTWDTPDVAHDNPRDQRYHASLILGFDTVATRDAFFMAPETQRLSSLIAPSVSAIHAYDVTETHTFVQDGHVLPIPQK